LGAPLAMMITAEKMGSLIAIQLQLGYLGNIIVGYFSV